MSFDWKEKVQFLRNNPRYNNAEDYGIEILPKENSNWLVSVYHLLPDENRGNHSIYIEVLCKQNERQTFRAVHWGWQGMSAQQKNEIGAIFADKPDNEIKSHPIFSEQHIWLGICGGDTIKNIHTQIDPDIPASDGSDGNKRFHHSYLVLFQEVDKDITTPEPEPEKELVLLINKKWINELETDSDGFVRIHR